MKLLSDLLITRALPLLGTLALLESTAKGEENCLDLDALLSDDAMLDKLILNDSDLPFALVPTGEPASEPTALVATQEPLPEAVEAEPTGELVFLDALLDSFPDPQWDWETSVAGGIGYKRNVLFSAFDTDDSAFTSLEFDSTLIRLNQPDDWQFFAYVLAENKHYFDVEGLGDEWLAILIAQAEWPLKDHWRVGLSGQYTYLDQAFSLAFEEFDFGSTKIVLHQPEITPSLTYRFLERAYVKVELPMAMNWFQESDQDYNQLGVDVKVGTTGPQGGGLELTYGCEHRNYDERLVRDVSGNALAGEPLEWRQHQLELIWSHYFDNAKAWRSITGLRLCKIEDNGVGYHDFWMYRASQRLIYVQDSWTITTKVSYTYHDYPVQTVGEDSPNHRHRSRLAVGLNMECKFGEDWRMIAGYEFEDYLSNVVEDEYDVHVMSIGLRRSF